MKNTNKRVKIFHAVIFHREDGQLMSAGHDFSATSHKDAMITAKRLAAEVDGRVYSLERKRAE